MEQQLERSMQLLLEQMARQEARNAQLQKRFHWLSVAFALTLILLVGMTFQVQMVNKAHADNTFKLLKEDFENLSKLLAAGAKLVSYLESEQGQQTVGKAAMQTANIIDNADKIATVFASSEAMETMQDLGQIVSIIAVPENAEALKKLSHIINHMAEGKIFNAIGSLGKDMKAMSHNMYVMTVDMRRMSSTATPAMGRMYDMMRVMPIP